LGRNIRVRVGDARVGAPIKQWLGVGNERRQCPTPNTALTSPRPLQSKAAV
jgi:hypothetical protein